ncbi:MAG: Spy/CpxP family protein refolding chaperone [Candidatus Acidiferrales bacterium]
MKKLFASAVLAAMFAVPATFAQNASTDAQAPTTQTSTDQATAQAPAAAKRFQARLVQRRVAKMTALLSLTPVQQTQVAAILTNAAQSRTGERGSMKQARAQMRTAIESNDSATIEQVSNTIGNMAAQNAAARAKTAAAIFQILTPDQKAKAQQLADLFGNSGRGRHSRPAGA